MFIGIVATGDKAWVPSLGTLPSEFFEDVDNDILKENEKENTINDVHISSQVGCDFDRNNQKKKKTLEAGTSHFKIGRKKFSKQIEEAVRLSSQIEKLCSATNNMSQATSSLTLIMDPYGIPQAIKLLDSLSEEVPEASLL
ncbi:hypothetical protein Goshw_008000 [Gossypium schwendimanii]|uniref:Uncharacterized protein n=3 Tax=Gossypium TaxID=3633 RepID=A0A7J9KQS3_GOSSC|nr:hypothetical protein [Gossypium schwendimanii]